MLLLPPDLTGGCPDSTQPEAALTAAAAAAAQAAAAAAAQAAGAAAAGQDKDKDCVLRAAAMLPDMLCIMGIYSLLRKQ
jgi:hypothetical protein